MAVTARTLVGDALIEVGVADPIDAPSAVDAERGLRILNRDILDPWNAQRQFAFARRFDTFSWPNGEASRTIGPTGNFVIPHARPIEILDANRIDQTVHYPVNIRDAAWFAGLSIPNFNSTWITDIYYSPEVPHGTIRAWPVPTTTQSLQLETYVALAQFVTLDASADFAPGYESAVIETLKELCYAAWHRPQPPEQRERAMKARALVQVANAALVRRRIHTDAPSSGTGAIGSDSVGFRARQF